MSDTVKNREEKEPLLLPQLCHDGAVSGEVSEDFVLPDYMPQISRILRLETRAIPEGKYLGQGNVEFSGAVAYTIVYASGDSRICSVSLSSDYGGKSELPEGECECTVATAVENASCRLLGPRKLSTRARLRTRILVFRDAPFSAVTERAGQDAAIERLCETAGSCRSRFFEARDVRLEERMDDAAGKPVCCSAVIVPGTVLAQNDAVIVSGEACVRILLEEEDAPGGTGRYRSAVRRMPFERTVRADGVRPGDRAAAVGCCVSVTVGAGEEGEVPDCAVSFDLAVTVCRREEFSFCRDAYAVSRSCEAQNAVRELELYETGRVGGNFTLSAAAARRDVNAATAGEIVDVAAYPEVTSVTVENGRLIASGSAKINVIMREKLENAQEGEDGYFVSAGEFQAPFKYECEAPVTGGELIWLASPLMLVSSGRLDGDRISVDVEVGMALLLWAKTRKAAVEKTVLAAAAPRSGGMVLCYPDGSESLWQLAKKYRVPVEKLAADNEIKLAGEADRLRVPPDGSSLLVDLL